MAEKNIHTAIIEVYKAVGYVQKKRSPEGGVNYAYAGEAALIEALRPAMIEAGIYCHVAEVVEIQRDAYETSNQKAMNRTAMRLRVRFTHAESGTYIDCEAWGEGADVADKSVPKALTGAFKYALRETFCIETGTDPDDTGSQRQARATTPARKAPASAPGVPTRDVNADVPKVSGVTLDEDKARSGFWAGLRELGLDQAAAHVFFGVEVKSGALGEYVAKRAAAAKTSPAAIWTRMKKQVEKAVEFDQVMKGAEAFPSPEEKPAA